MKRRLRIAYSLLAVLACVISAASYAVIAPHHAAASPDPETIPPAPLFTKLFIHVADTAAEHGEHVVRPHCDDAGGGHFICAYTVVSLDGAEECHLMQAKWTPESEDLFEITLAGRTGRCSSIRAAVNSLQ